MTKAKATAQKRNGLRKKAEKLLFQKGSNIRKMSTSDIEKLVHELQVHQIELETQNDELRKTQQELELSREKYAALFELAPIGYFTLDQFGKILEANLTGAEMLAADRSLLINKPFTLFVMPDDLERFRSHRLKAFREPDICELSLRRIDGTSFFAQMKSLFVKKPPGNSAAVRTAVIDVTEHKELEGQRAKLEQQLLQAQKLESIGTLTGGIAHDFNNILQTININADLALLDLPDGSGVRNNVDLILKSAMQGKDLVRQMLLFSRKSEKKQEVITLTPLIKETFKLLRSSLPTTIQMKLLLETESDTVYADPSQIQQVVMNLCTNAAYAMRGTMGSIDICLQTVTFGSMDVPKKDMQPGDYLVLSVKDTGSGMDEETKKRIFEPFFTTKPVGEGTGLGLSVVYGIVKSHKGNITVYSEPGRGSTFKVYLPKADTSVSVQTATLGPIPKGNERVLLVDDEEIIVNSVRDMLENLGYKVTALTNSQEALKVFSETPYEFDLVITDQTMPFMTGETLGKEIMRIQADIPVILCTGHSDMISSERAMAMGFRGYIMKPFTIREGAELVRRVLDQALIATNESRDKAALTPAKTPAQ